MSEDRAKKFALMGIGCAGWTVVAVVVVPLLLCGIGMLATIVIPPTAKQAEGTSPRQGSTTPSSGANEKEVQVTGLSFRRVKHLVDETWEYTWKLTVTNLDVVPRSRVTVRVVLLDKDGFQIGKDIQVISLDARESRDVTGLVYGEGRDGAEIRATAQ